MLVLFNVCVTVLFKKFGITVKWVESDDPKEFRNAIDERTKAIYIETIGNPKFNIPNIAEIAEAGDLLEILVSGSRLTGYFVQVAHKKEIPLIVDNTFGLGGRLLRRYWTGP